MGFIESEQRPAARTTPQYSILIADPHIIVAELFCTLLGRESACTADAVDSMTGLFAAARAQHYDMILLDCTLLDYRGMSSIRELVAEFPMDRLVLFADCEDYGLLAEAFKAGLHSHVPKMLSKKSLLATIELIKAGESFIPALEMPKLLHLRREAPDSKGGFSAEHIELLSMIDAGLSNKDIGRRLGTTETRVKAKLRVLYGQIGARNRVHAVHIAKSKEQYTGSAALSGCATCTRRAHVKSKDSLPCSALHANEVVDSPSEIEHMP